MFLFVEKLEKALLVGKITVFLRSWGRLLAQFFANGSLFCHKLPRQAFSWVATLVCDLFKGEDPAGFELTTSLL